MCLSQNIESRNTIFRSIYFTFGMTTDTSNIFSVFCLEVSRSWVLRYDVICIQDCYQAESDDVQSSRRLLSTSTSGTPDARGQGSLVGTDLQNMMQFDGGLRASAVTASSRRCEIA